MTAVRTNTAISIGWKLNIILLLAGTCIASTPSKQEPSKECSSNVDKIIESAFAGEFWAQQIVDAQSKLQTGLMIQGFKHHLPTHRVPDDAVRLLGNFAQCTEPNTRGPFPLQYCSIDAHVTKFEGFTWSPPKHVITDVCVPDVCTTTDLKLLSQNYSSRLGLEIEATVNDVTCQLRHKPVSDQAMNYNFVLKLMFMLVVMATLYDVTILADSPGPDFQGSQGTFNDVIVSFSLYSNIPKVVNTGQKRIECIDGIKFFTVVWVIMGQFIHAGQSSMDNVLPFWKKATRYVIFDLLTSYTLALDVFLVVSGVLTTYNALRKLKSANAKPSADFFKKDIFSRVLRLAPMYVVFVMVSVSLFNHLSDGPFWPQGDLKQDSCRYSWWVSLLQLNAGHVTSVTGLLIGWMFLAAMFLNVVSPIVISGLHSHGDGGLVLPAGVVAACSMLSCVSSYVYKESPRIGPNVMPYSHLSPYMIGMITGYLLHTSDGKAKLSKVTVALGWVVALSLDWWATFGLHGYNNGQPMGDVMSALYNGLHRPAIALTVSWYIFACSNGYGGFVNTLLSWKVFSPLGKMMHSIYMLHPIVMLYFVLSKQRLYYLNINTIILAAAGLTTATILFAIVTHLFVELPFINLSKVIHRIRSSQPKSDVKTKSHKD